MATHRGFTTKCGLFGLALVLLTHVATGQAQSKKTKYACSEPDPASICNASNTCGSDSAPCSVDVKRTNYGASATPSIGGAKGNSTFCVKAGKSVTWKSDSKHVGFVVDTGPTSPFDPPDDIIGGSNRSVTAVAKTPGCYKYSVGACISGEIYGMCGNSTAEMVIVK